MARGYRMTSTGSGPKVLRPDESASTARVGDRIRVMIVGAFPPPSLKVYGGVVTVCRTLVESEFGEEFDLFLLDTTQASNPPPGFAVRAVRALRRFMNFLRMLFRSRPDTVILFASVGASLYEKAAMAWFARLTGCTPMLFPGGGKLMDTVVPGTRRTRVLAAYLKGSRYFLCQGPAWKRFATDVLGFRPEQAPIIPNWTATEEHLAVGAARARPTPADRELRLVFVGWLEEKKGVLDLVTACAALKDRAWHLDLVGLGHAEETVRTRLREAGLESRVTFHGWLSPDQVRRRLAEADVFVLPSWGEGLPNAMIEAMAAGVAVVVTSVGNIPDVVEHGVHGLVVPPRDPRELTRSLALLFADRALLDRLAENGRTLADAEFSVPNAVAHLSRVVRVGARSR